MKIWITTDTHFGHDKMQEYCGRPDGFEYLILKYQSYLSFGDLLIHLGDFCIGNDKNWHDKFMARTPSKKILIRGNHDRKSDSWYLNNGWDFVCEQFRNTYFGKDILFSHCPKPDIGYDINIHGHFHNQLPRLLKGEWAVDDEEKRNHYDLKALNPKSKLLALEETNYQPVNLEKFI